MSNSMQRGQDAGQIYRELPDERGTRTDLGASCSKVEAIEQTGKERHTLNRWAKDAGIMLLDIEARIGELSYEIPQEHYKGVERAEASTGCSC